MSTTTESDAKFEMKEEKQKRCYYLGGHHKKDSACENKIQNTKYKIQDETKGKQPLTARPCRSPKDKI
jgi:hypothetical protein